MYDESDIMSVEKVSGHSMGESGMTSSTKRHASITATRSSIVKTGRRLYAVTVSSASTPHHELIAGAPRRSQ